MNDHINIANVVLTGISIAPVSSSTTLTGNGIDLRNGGAETVAFIALGVIASGSTWTVKLQESLNDNAADAEAAAEAYADITGATTTVADTDDGTLVKITTNSRAKRYVRAIATATGSGATVMGVTILAAKRTSGAPQ